MRHRVDHAVHDGRGLRSTILHLCENREIGVIDVHLEFAKHVDPPALYTEAFHYTDEGYRIVAETVLRAIRDEN